MNLHQVALTTQHLWKRMELDWYSIIFQWKHLFITVATGAFVCFPELPPLKEIGILCNLDGPGC